MTDAVADVSASATYQWQVLDGTTWTTVGAGASYTPSQADEDKALRVVVTYAGDAAGSESTIVSAGTVQDIAGGDLFASLGGLTAGNAVQDSIVSVATVTHAGIPVSGATYQWQVFNGTTWTNISGATNATYTPAEADEGKALQVVVFYSSESTTVSAGVIQETAAGDLAATLGGLTSGNAVQGTAVSVATVTDNGTDVHASATYQWQVFNGTSWTNISGATNATYTPAEADEGKALRAVVTYAGDAAGSESTIVSAGTVQETAAGDLVATLSGLTSGNALQGTAVSVTAVTDSGTDVHLSATYQWQVFNGTSWTYIAGATNVTYTPAEADEGKALRVVVTYAGDAAGSESTIVSAGTVQEIAAGDLVGDAWRTDRRQRASGHGRQRGDGDRRWSRCSVGCHLPVAGSQRHDLERYIRRDERNLRAGRGRRRQGAAGGGDLCRRRGGFREHDGLCRHRAGDCGR